MNVVGVMFRVVVDFMSIIGIVSTKNLLQRSDKMKGAEQAPSNSYC
jgi:hypothetical protein